MPVASTLAVTVFPDFDAVGGRELILEVLGALLTIVLVAAVLVAAGQRDPLGAGIRQRQLPARRDRQGRGAHQPRGRVPGRGRHGVDELPHRPRPHPLTQAGPGRGPGGLRTFTVEPTRGVGALAVKEPVQCCTKSSPPRCPSWCR